MSNLASVLAPTVFTSASERSASPAAVKPPCRKDRNVMLGGSPATSIIAFTRADEYRQGPVTPRVGHGHRGRPNRLQTDVAEVCMRGRRIRLFDPRCHRRSGGLPASALRITPQ